MTQRHLAPGNDFTDPGPGRAIAPVLFKTRAGSRRCNRASAASVRRFATGLSTPRVGKIAAEKNARYIGLLTCGKEAGQGVAWQRIGAWSFLMLLTVAEKSLELGDFLQARSWVSEQWPVSTTIVIETACVNTFTDEARVAVMVTGRSDFAASQA